MNSPVAVEIEFAGTASADDYTAPPNIYDVGYEATFSITPIDDKVADGEEGDGSETLVVKIKADDTHYLIAANAGEAAATIADDSQWYYGSWALEEGLANGGTHSLGSHSVEESYHVPGGGLEPSYEVHYTRHTRYMAYDTWRYVGVSDESDNWDDSEDISFELSEGESKTIEMQAGMSLPEGFSLNVTVGATLSTGTGASEEYTASSQQNTKAFLCGYVLHRRIVKYTRLEGLGNNTETSETLLEGDLLGRYEGAIWRRERIWLDPDSPRAAGLSLSDTAAGDPPPPPNA
jgi:hypothetical protein